MLAFPFTELISHLYSCHLLCCLSRLNGLSLWDLAAIPVTRDVYVQPEMADLVGEPDTSEYVYDDVIPLVNQIEVSTLCYLMTI